MSTGAYPGVGKPLYYANSSFPQEPVWAGMRNPTEVIPDDGYSIPFPLNAGFKSAVSAIYASAPTTDAFEIWVSLKADLSDEYLLDTVAASTDTTYQFVIDVDLTGVCRIRNIGTASIEEAYAQQLTKV